jgi:hypothetical protein
MGPVTARRTNRVEAWLRRQAERESRAVYLEDALLRNRFGSYAAYRLKYFAARYGAELILHGVKFVLLAFVFAHVWFAPAVVVTAGAAAVTSFWWGALEVMRERVRHLARTGRPDLVRRVIGGWLALATGLALPVVLVPAGWTAWAIRDGTADLPHAYVLALSARVALELVWLTFHSGVYAIRRIYRPLPAILGAELAGLGLILCLWAWVGPWSLPLAMFASAVIAAITVFHYTARLYRFLGLFPLACPRLASLRRPGWRTLGEFAGAGTAFALMKLDALLVVALFSSRATGADGRELFVLLFAISPTIRAGLDWAQLFYFDLKRLEASWFANLRRRYETFLVGLALALGVAFWLLGWASGSVLMGASLAPVGWLLGPFFVWRAVLALLQVRAFAEGRYLPVVVSGLLLVGGAALLPGWMTDGRYALAGLAGLMVAGIGLLAPGRSEARGAARAGRDARVLPLAAWVEALRGVRGPVEVTSLRVWREPATRSRDGVDGRARDGRLRVIRMAERVARRLGVSGAATTIGPDRLVWYETGRRRPALPGWLLVALGGLVESIRSSGPMLDGPEAFARACRLGLLGPWRGRGGGAPRRPQDVVRRFRTIFPEGIVYDPQGPVPAALARLSSRERRAVLIDASYFATRLRRRRPWSRFDVTTLCRGNDLELAFLVDRRVEPRRRARWAADIRRITLEAAIGPRAARR